MGSFGGGFGGLFLCGSGGRLFCNHFGRRGFFFCCGSGFLFLRCGFFCQLFGSSLLFSLLLGLALASALFGSGLLLFGRSLFLCGCLFGCFYGLCGLGFSLGLASAFFGNNDSASIML